MISRIDCRNISAPGSRFTTARNEGGSRSNITAVMICSAFWPRSVCPRARRNMGGPALRCAGLLLAFGLLVACDRAPTASHDATRKRKSGRNFRARKRSRTFRRWWTSVRARREREAIEKMQNVSHQTARAFRLEGDAAGFYRHHAARENRVCKSHRDVCREGECPILSGLLALRHKDIRHGKIRGRERRWIEHRRPARTGPGPRPASGPGPESRTRFF